MQNYLVSEELLRIREDIIRVLQNSMDTEELNRHFLNLEEEVLKIDNTFTTLVDRRKKIPDDKMKDECLTVLKKETLRNQLQPARKIRNLLYTKIEKIYQKLFGETDVSTIE